MVHSHTSSTIGNEPNEVNEIPASLHEKWRDGWGDLESLGSAGKSSDDEQTRTASFSLCTTACMIWSATDESKSQVEGKARERRDP